MDKLKLAQLLVKLYNQEHLGYTEHQIASDLCIYPEAQDWLFALSNNEEECGQALTQEITHMLITYLMEVSNDPRLQIISEYNNKKLLKALSKE